MEINVCCFSNWMNWYNNDQLSRLQKWQVEPISTVQKTIRRCTFEQWTDEDSTVSASAGHRSRALVPSVPGGPVWRGGRERVQRSQKGRKGQVMKRWKEKYNCCLPRLLQQQLQWCQWQSWFFLDYLQKVWDIPKWTKVWSGVWRRKSTQCGEDKVVEHGALREHNILVNLLTSSQASNVATINVVPL